MTTRSLPAAIIGEMRERVAKATGPDQELDAVILAAVAAPEGSFVEQSPTNGAWCIYNGRTPRGEPRSWERRDWWRDGGWPLTASIDAALALVERKVPDAFWLVGRGKTRDEEPPFGCQLLFGTDEILGEGEGPTPPLAILAALLQALEQTR